MANRELGAAIVGTGFAGASHAHAVRAAGAVLVGVVGSTPERGAAAAARLGAQCSFASVEDAIASDAVDVVHVCSPNAGHASTALDCLAAGKHVVCEKPVALDLVEADAMVAAWRRSGLVATVPFVYRYYPMVREMRSRIAAGELGRLHLLHGSYLQDWLAGDGQTNWRVDQSVGGRSRAFADIGSHWCDLLEYVVGQRISALSAQTDRAYHVRPSRDGDPSSAVGGAEGQAPVHNEDIALLQFRTDRGVRGSAVISQVSPGRKNRLVLEVSGSSGSAAFNQERPDTIWLGRRESSALLSTERGSLSPDAARLATLPSGHPHGWLNCLEGFVADSYGAIRGEAAPEGLPTLADGRRAVALAEAVLESAADDSNWVTPADARGDFA